MDILEIFLGIIFLSIVFITAIIFIALALKWFSDGLFFLPAAVIVLVIAYLIKTLEKD